MLMTLFFYNDCSHEISNAITNFQTLAIVVYIDYYFVKQKTDR